MRARASSLATTREKDCKDQASHQHSVGLRFGDISDIDEYLPLVIDIQCLFESNGPFRRIH